MTKPSNICPSAPRSASGQISLAWRAVWVRSRAWSSRPRRRWPSPWRKHGAMSNSNRRRTWTKPDGAKGGRVPGCGRRSRPRSPGVSCGGRAVGRWPGSSWVSAVGDGWSRSAGVRTTGSPRGVDSSAGRICGGISRPCVRVADHPKPWGKPCGPRCVSCVTGGLGSARGRWRRRVSPARCGPSDVR